MQSFEFLLHAIVFGARLHEPVGQLEINTFGVGGYREKQLAILRARIGGLDEDELSREAEITCGEVHLGFFSVEIEAVGFRGRLGLRLHDSIGGFVVEELEVVHLYLFEERDGFDEVFIVAPKIELRKAGLIFEFREYVIR